VKATVGIYELLIEFYEDSKVFKVKQVNDDVDTKVINDIIQKISILVMKNLI